jgi:hypothetical protein
MQWKDGRLVRADIPSRTGDPFDRRHDGKPRVFLDQVTPQRAGARMNPQPNSKENP